MDFFQAQARAKVRSSRLVVCFFLAVVAIILTLYTVISTALVAMQQQQQRRADFVERVEPPAPWWDLSRFLLVTGAVVVVVGGASLYKISELSAGGGAVAQSVGGRKLDPTTRKTDERRLLNIVEEMAIASGVPMPEVYILDNEQGINAFAAGHNVNDAAVAVTRGCLEILNRDELQGVIAHEFSHILNGDMKLNLRIAGTIYGILVLGILGGIILQVMGRGRIRSGRGGKGDGATMLVFLIGIALMIVGYLGTFFGRLIQAAVSRQREFLADASAVQFTRNPGGIGGALKKISAFYRGSTIENGAAAGFAHFFFSSAISSGLTGLLATHPPLEERIRAVDPSWDGTLPKIKEGDSAWSHKHVEGTSGFAGEEVASPPPLRTKQNAGDHISVKPRDMLASAGTLGEGQAAFARQILGSIPGALREAANDPHQAQALLIGLLMNDDPAHRGPALALVREKAPRPVSQALGFLLPAVLARPPWEKMPLIELCLPTLKDLPRAEKEALFQLSVSIAAADQKTSIFEFSLLELTKRRFGFNQARPGRDAAPAASRVLSAMALVSEQMVDRAETLFKKSLGETGSLGEMTFIQYSNQDFNALSEALEILASASFETRRVVLESAADIIASDGEITVAEAELYRAIAICLDVPVPPILATVRSR